MTIPLLKADDIECRVQQVKQSYDKRSVEAIILLYKDARCDMKYLDLLFGTTGWERSHTLIGDRLYCTVRIWDSEKNTWIAKEDVGTESNTEKEKGQASDAFKRACFNVGIGRELYTAPMIKITLNEREYSGDNGKYKTYATFAVKEIEYDDERRISRLVIVDRFDNVRYTYPEVNSTKSKKTAKETKSEEKQLTPRQRLFVLLEEHGIDTAAYSAEHSLSKETPESVILECIAELEAL